MIDGPGRRLGEFIHDTALTALPPGVQRQLKRCLLDLLGSMLAGALAPVSGAAAAAAREQWPGAGAPLVYSGGTAHPAGAAFAGGVMANALDIDDGYRPVKGHPGAAVIPAALAAGCATGAAGDELLAAIAVGYEVALATGLLTHAGYADYHASGSWAAAGAAAVTARLLGLPRGPTLHALGIAEYHAPISPMVRCLDAPAMVKDGIGWGSMVGVASAYLARAGFTGIPPALAQDGPVTGSLGESFRLEELYFKPYACCRWAHPAIAAALQVAREHDLTPAGIGAIVVETHSLGARLGGSRPRDTEEAQYSIPFPVAAALVHGRVGPRQVLGEGLDDEAVLALAGRVRLVAAADLDALFPGRCLARVRVLTAGGREATSAVHAAPWDPDRPPTDDELEQKFNWLAGEVLPAPRAAELLTLVREFDRVPDVNQLVVRTVPGDAG